jgi:hypothetical protein
MWEREAQSENEDEKDGGKSAQHHYRERIQRSYRMWIYAYESEIIGF